MLEEDVILLSALTGVAAGKMDRSCTGEGTRPPLANDVIVI